MKSFLRFHIVALAVLIGISAVSAQAQTAPQPEKFSNIKIKNFGQMDTNYYRGAQPKKEDFQALATLGVKTVVDLRNDPVTYEKSAVEALGMKYINIPMDDAEYPSEASINAFLAIVNDESNGAVYVHCKGGKHRTGVTGAAYRFTKYGWDYDKTFREMENYAFHTKWGRKVMKDFVIDYAAKMRERDVTSASAAATGNR
jgi:protein tyrosine/serine phosphatase